MVVVVVVWRRRKRGRVDRAADAGAGAHIGVGADACLDPLPNVDVMIKMYIKARC